MPAVGICFHIIITVESCGRVFCEGAVLRPFHEILFGRNNLNSAFTDDYGPIKQVDQVIVQLLDLAM